MIRIERIIGGNLQANCWIPHHGAKSEAFIIDPGFLHKKYIAVCRELRLRVKGVLLTHHHYDHSDAAELVAKEWGVPVFLHRRDLPFYKGRADAILEGGELFTLDDEPLHVLPTPGHTPGGVCFSLPESKVCFTGDTIFNVDLGRTDFTGGSETEMRHSLTTIINTWPNDTTIYPGHGDPATMKYVRANNHEFLAMLGER